MKAESMVEWGQARGGPFDLADSAAYLAWRERKLAAHPRAVADLAVEVRDPAAPTVAEAAALHDRLRRANMALYVGPVLDAVAAKAAVKALGLRFGLVRLDANLCADEDAITPLQVDGSGTRPRYIPYTDQPIKWHTDGYYNRPDRQIRGLILHCVRQAAEGGGNALMDHEVAYILLRDKDPALVAALQHPQAMTIPPNADEGGELRGVQPGPVFSVDPATGSLHMRYTMRRRNIVWRDDAATRAAVAALESLLGDPANPYVFRHRMTPGQGLICNNVLHDRAGFRDSAAARRLMFRGRYFDRIAGTAPADGGTP